MKKVFTLFAAALVGLCAFAQDDGPCPSRLYFEPAEAEQPAENAMFLLKLENSSANLNGFNMEVQKPDEAEWVMDEEDGEWVGFTGYGHTILALWEPSNPNWRETRLFQKADLKCSVKEVTHEDGTVHPHLVIIEILSTLDCRFFPVLTTEDDNTIARFSVDFSGCEDNAKEPIVLTSENTPSGCSFSFTDGPEGNRAWTIDEPIILNLEKSNGIIKEAATTAISEISTDKAGDNRIFDLQGRELSRVPESGVYIQNGKKYVK